MQNVLEQGPDFWSWFNTTQFSYHCVHPIHAKMFSIQMLLHFSQIALRVCTSVLFIFVIKHYITLLKKKHQKTVEYEIPALVTSESCMNENDSSGMDCGPTERPGNVGEGTEGVT